MGKSCQARLNKLLGSWSLMEVSWFHTWDHYITIWVAIPPWGWQSISSWLCPMGNPQLYPHCLWPHESLLVPNSSHVVRGSPSLEPIATTSGDFPDHHIWCGNSSVFICFEQSFLKLEKPNLEPLITLLDVIGFNVRPRFFITFKPPVGEPRAPGCRAVGHQALNHSALLQELFSDLQTWEVFTIAENGDLKKKHNRKILRKKIQTS